MNNKLKLIWSLTQEPNEKVHYNHVYAETPFGRIVIRWVLWRGSLSYDIEEMPGHDDRYLSMLMSCDTESAEREAENIYYEWLDEALVDSEIMTDKILDELKKFRDENDE